MYDKAKLGTRYVCFKCGTKFYDLNRPEPTCPECGADQTEAPKPTIKSLLSRGGGRSRSKSTDDGDFDEGNEDEDDLDIDIDDEDEDDDDDLGSDDEDDDE